MKQDQGQDQSRIRFFKAAICLLDMVALYFEKPLHIKARRLLL